VGRRNGRALIGSGEISGDPHLTKKIVEDYPRKYLLAGLGYHRPKQERFDRGQVVAIRVTPIRELPDGFASEPGRPAPGITNTAAADDPPPAWSKSIVGAQLANLLSASRFVLAAMWLLIFASGNRSPRILGWIALAAAASDFADGRVARWLGQADGSGRWLDALADIAFVLTALSCEAVIGVLPIYIPVLIALSFAQYAIDSVAISRSSMPVKSRLGHWGGVVNFALVLVLAWTPSPSLSARLLRQASPVIAMFYIAAMFERALGYRPLRTILRHKAGKIMVGRGG
jgi:cardiolipin synthase